MRPAIKHIILLLTFAWMLTACEKEIDIDVDPGKQVLVVEASVNQFSATLNYVFITSSVDYFKPDLSFGGIGGASVYIYEGEINGKDTVYAEHKKFRMFGAEDIPLLPDSITSLVPGIYINPYFVGKENTPYKLDITLRDGRKVTGYTFIPKIVPITKTYYEIKGERDTAGKREAYMSFSFTDPQEQNNYRIALKKGGDTLALGWGNADSYRTFDDVPLNGIERTYPFASAFRETDTLNLYFTTIGRKEFLFWQSFGSASNSGNPFATPAVLKSNITGATGCFVGYGVSFKRIIFK